VNDRQIALQREVHRRLRRAEESSEASLRKSMHRYQIQLSLAPLRQYHRILNRRGDEIHARCHAISGYPAAKAMRQTTDHKPQHAGWYKQVGNEYRGLRPLPLNIAQQMPNLYRHRFLSDKMAAHGIWSFWRDRLVKSVYFQQPEKFIKAKFIFVNAGA